MAEYTSQAAYTLTIAELQKKDDEQLRHADEAIRTSFANTINKALEKSQFRTRSDNNLVQELLTGSKRLEDIFPGGTEGKWEQVIKNACTEYQELRDVTFLFICAPRTQHPLSLKQDGEARDKQMQHFYNIMTLNRDKEKCLQETVHVLTYGNLLQRLNAFMQEDAAKAKRAYIVYNGHGYTNGNLSLENEIGGISTTRFINDVNKAWKALKQSQEATGCSVVRPEHIPVVLAHCYGYKHQLDPEIDGVVEVICLTSTDDPETHFAYKLNTPRTAVKDAVHIELMVFGRDEVQDEAHGATGSVDDNESDLRTVHNKLSPDSDKASINNPKQVSSSFFESQTRLFMDTTALACLVFSLSAEQSLDFMSSFDIKSYSNPRKSVGEAGALRVCFSPMFGCMSSRGKLGDGIASKIISTSSIAIAVAAPENKHVTAVRPRRGVKTTKPKCGIVDALKHSNNLLTAPLTSNVAERGLQGLRLTNKVDKTSQKSNGRRLRTQIEKKKKETKANSGSLVGGLSAIVESSAVVGRIAQDIKLD